MKSTERTKCKAFRDKTGGMKHQKKVELCQRGATEAQNGYGFSMFPGHGLHDGYLSSLALDGSPTEVQIVLVSCQQHLSLKGPHHRDCA